MKRTAAIGTRSKKRELFLSRAEPVKGRRVLRFRGATENVARDGGILESDGWRLDEYAKNPVFLYAHQHEGLPLGRTLSVERDGSNLDFEVEFPEAGVHGFADTVFDLYRTGFMKAVSVGFRVNEKKTRDPTPEERERGAEWVSTDHELLELSAVPVGADPDALMTAARALPKSAAKHLRQIGLDDFVALAREVETMKRAKVEERDGTLVVVLRDESEFDEGAAFVEHDFGEGVTAVVGTLDGEGAIQGLRFDEGFERDAAEAYLDDERVEALLAWRASDEDEGEDEDDADGENADDGEPMDDDEDEDSSEEDEPRSEEDSAEDDDDEERVYTRSDVVGILREAAGALIARADEIESPGDPEGEDEEDPEEDAAGSPRGASSESRGSKGESDDDPFGIIAAARAYAGE